MQKFRIFPKPKQDIQMEFITHSCALEGIQILPEDITRAIRDGSRKMNDSNPHVVGHFAALNLIVTNAYKTDLFPTKTCLVSTNVLESKIQMVQKIHTALFDPVAKHSERLLGTQLMALNMVGKFRQRAKKLGPRQMPDHREIRTLLKEWFIEAGEFQETWNKKLNTPGIYSMDDIDQINNICYDLHLKLICIKPFEDGSNRVARIMWNLLRMNSGLPFWVIKKDNNKSYLDDIFRMQDLVSSRFRDRDLPTHVQDIEPSR